MRRALLDTMVGLDAKVFVAFCIIVEARDFSGRHHAVIEGFHMNADIWSRRSICPWSDSVGHYRSKSIANVSKT